MGFFGKEDGERAGRPRSVRVGRMASYEDAIGFASERRAEELAKLDDDKRSAVGDAIISACVHVANMETIAFVYGKPLKEVHEAVKAVMEEGSDND